MATERMSSGRSISKVKLSGVGVIRLCGAKGEYLNKLYDLKAEAMKSSKPYCLVLLLRSMALTGHGDGIRRFEHHGISVAWWTTLSFTWKDIGSCSHYRTWPAKQRSTTALPAADLQDRNWSKRCNFPLAFRGYLPSSPAVTWKRSWVFARSFR